MSSSPVTYTLPGGQFITVQPGQIYSNLKVATPSPVASFDREWNAAIDGVESLLLAMATRNIPMGTASMSDAVATTIEALSEQFPIE